MHQYDVAMKELFQSVGSGLMERLAGGAPVEWLNIELAETRAPRVDFVCRLKDSSIFHMEFQGLNDPLMVWRMLEYLVAIFKRYGSVPRQVVLYMGNEPLRMANSVAFASLQFQFEIIDLGELDAEELLASPHISDVVLAILCRKPDPAIRLQRIIARIRNLEPEQRKRAARQLLILSMKRQLAKTVLKEIETMAVTFEIEDDELLRDLYEKGRKEGMNAGLNAGRNEGRNEGRIEGRLDAEKTMLRFQLRQKFGSLSHAHEDRINGATHEELQVWVARVMPATSIGEIFNG